MAIKSSDDGINAAGGVDAVIGGFDCHIPAGNVDRLSFQPFVAGEDLNLAVGKG